MSFTIQIDVCAESDTRRLFSLSSAEEVKFVFTEKGIAISMIYDIISGSHFKVFNGVIELFVCAKNTSDTNNSK